MATLKGHKDHSHEPASKGYVRNLFVLFASLTLLAIGAAGLILSTNAVNSNRAGCERANHSRVATLHLYQALVQVNQERIDAGQKAGSPAAEIEANRFARDLYYDAMVDYIASQSEFSYAPDDVDSDDSVRIDCARAYPYPWPFG